MNNWYYRRVQAFILALFIGAGLGLLVSFFFACNKTIALLIGALIGLTLLWIWDLKNAFKVMHWLQDENAASHLIATSPVTTVWSELSRRTVRILRKRDRQILYEQEQLELILSALQIAPVGLILLDSHNRVQWGNTSASKYLSLFFPKDYQQQITNLLRQPEIIDYFETLDHKKSVEPLTIKWGKDHQNSLLISTVFYDHEQKKLMMLQDVTEHERSDQMRRDFVANVSHEIRTPLTVLAGFIETMQTLPLQEQDRLHYLGLMAEQSTRMHHLINDLLTLAKLEAAPSPGLEHWVSVNILMAQAQLTANQLSSGKHKLQFHEPLSNTQIAGDESELIGALTNLVANAIRYTPPESTIQVGWQVNPDGSGFLYVQDNGPGIAKEHLTRLSERFYRIDRSRSRQTGGTGLGLSIVKHTMQRHNGSLLIESEPGKGAKFIMQLPKERILITP